MGSTVLADTPLATWLAGVSYAEVREHNPSDNALPAATQAKAHHAYWVRVSAPSTWTPPLPKDVTTRSVYDGDGGRVKQVTPSGTTTFFGQSYEKDPTGKTTKYVFAGGQRLAAKDSTGALRFYHGDHLGSSNVVTDGTGAQVELAGYAPYGSLNRREGTTDIPQKFTGQRLDAESGLYFYNARYYDPMLGRFIQADTIVPSPGDPQALNRYAYVRNNPVNFVDPSGHFWFIPALIFSAIKAAVVGAAIGAAVSAGFAAITGGDVGRAALAGAAGGAILGVGAAAAGVAFSGSTVSALVGRASVMAGAGALGGTASAAVSGGDLGRGAAFGALGAGAFSIIGALPLPNNVWGTMAEIGLSAGVGGGISKLAGGEFWQGAAVAGTLSSGRQIYRAVLKWNNQKIADPSLRTSDGTWGAKDGFCTHGTCSLKSDVGIALATDAKPNPFVKYLVSESSLPMRTLSRIIPALDSTAEMHDPLVYQVGRFMPGFTGPLYNQGTIPLAYGTTVAGALYNPPLVGTILGSYNYDDE